MADLHLVLRPGTAVRTINTISSLPITAFDSCFKMVATQTTGRPEDTKAKAMMKPCNYKPWSPTETRTTPNVWCLCFLLLECAFLQLPLTEPTLQQVIEQQVQFSWNKYIFSWFESVGKISPCSSGLSEACSWRQQEKREAQTFLSTHSSGRILRCSKATERHCPSSVCSVFPRASQNTSLKEGPGGFEDPPQLLLSV